MVRVRIGSSWATRFVRSGSSYLSQSELPMTIGLGSRAAADEAFVEWPSGTRDRIERLDAGRSYTITEGRGVTASQPLARQ